MKRFLSLLPAVALAIVFSLLTACGKKEVLHVYCWEDYFSDEVIANFEKEFNCKIQLDVFPSNEAMYAKLEAMQKEAEALEKITLASTDAVLG